MQNNNNQVPQGGAPINNQVPQGGLAAGAVVDPALAIAQAALVQAAAAGPAALAAALAAINQAQGQVPQANPLQAQGQAQVQAPIVFSIGPGTATHTIIDFSVSQGMKLFQAATASLYSPGNGFDMESGGVHGLMGRISEHAAYFGLDGGSGILSILKDHQDPLGETVSLITGYGLVSLEQVREHVALYANSKTRATQDSAMFFLCLMASLSEEGRTRVRIWREDYTYGEHLSGALLLKVIIRQACVDTKASTRHIRAKFTRLNKTFIKMDHNVVKLNQYVRVWLDGLKSRGGTTSDLLDQLFKAYKTSPDQELAHYVATLRNRYDEGEDITADELMKKVSKKYSTNKEEADDESEEESTTESEGLIAMQAKVTYLEQALAQQASTGGGGTGSDKWVQKKRLPMEPWKKVPPTAAEIAKGCKKKVNEKEYSFCAKHGYWCAHLTEDCKSDIKTKGGKTSEDQKRLVRAMVAIQEAEDSDHE
jgi:hypothetical protein